MSVADVECLLRESGLPRVSGISHDVRTLLVSEDPRAAEALDLFAFSAARQATMMAHSLGGLDCLVFTGGTGEHASAVRSAICARLGWLGVELDDVSNSLSRARICAEQSRIDVRIIPADEEIVIANHCWEIAGSGIQRPDIESDAVKDGSTYRLFADEAHEWLGAIRSKQHNGVRFRNPAFHAGRPGRHARHREAPCVGTLGEQAPNCRRGHMPLDQIASDFRRMTSG